MDDPESDPSESESESDTEASENEIPVATGEMDGPAAYMNDEITISFSGPRFAVLSVVGGLNAGRQILARDPRPSGRAMLSIVDEAMSQFQEELPEEQLMEKGGDVIIAQNVEETSELIDVVIEEPEESTTHE